MANTFRFCGKIALGRDSERFHPIEKKSFSSGWENMTVRFNVLSNTNRVLVTTQGGKWTNDSRNIVRTFSKSTADNKGTMIEIPWAKRFDESEISKVAGFRKFVVDLRDPHLKYALQDVVDGKRQIDDEMVNAGINSLAEAKKANAKKKEFLAEYDFSEYVAKLVASDKYKGSMFYVSGNYEVSYNADKQRYYTNYHVNRITLASDDAEPMTELKLDFFFGPDAWNDVDGNKYYINGWTQYYDNMAKANGFAPITVVVKENEKKVAALQKKFVCDDNQIRTVGLTTAVIDGAEAVEIDISMVDDETRADIEAGLVDWETLKRELGGMVMGDRISEIRYVKLTEKKNIPQDTVYHIEDMHEARAKIEKPVDVDDIFSDDEDDL